MLKVIDNAVTKPVGENQQALPRDQILVEGLVLPASIGVFDHEYTITQDIRFDVIVDILPLTADEDHGLENIVRYDHVVADIKQRLSEGHVELVETLAEDIAAKCLSYGRAEQVQVTVAKMDAIKEAHAVGVRITRRR